MTRFFNGTNGNDPFVGDQFDINIFNGLGVGSDRAVGGVLNDRFNMTVDGNVDRLDGGAGVDTIDYSRSALAVDINLSTGLVRADLNPLLPDVTVAEVRNIEDAVGSRFNDSITGSAVANRLDGGAGNDTIRAGAGNDTLIGGIGTNLLDGGTGIDTADYASANHSVIAFLNDGIGGQIDLETNEQFSQDTLVSIENLTGSRFDDWLVGSTGDNVINGGDGNDLLKGAGGSDTIHGDDGNDSISVSTNVNPGTNHLFGDGGDDSINGGESIDFIDGGIGDDYMFGGRGNDALTGGDGTDLLEGSVGADIMDGGAGNDTLMYRFSQQGVVVNLANQTASGGDAQGDAFSSIENVWGTQLGNDTLIGSSGNNVFFEQGGNNTLVGNGGRDTFAFMSIFEGSNLVADFRVGDDRLAIIGNETMQDLSFTQIGSGTVVSFEDTSILLLGVNTQDLLQHAATDIVFLANTDTLL